MLQTKLQLINFFPFYWQQIFDTCINLLNESVKEYSAKKKKNEFQYNIKQSYKKGCKQSTHKKECQETCLINVLQMYCIKNKK